MRYLVASLLFVFTMCTLISCTATITAHSFEMVPNTPVGTDGKFFYVKYGVIGTSSTYYDMYGGGDVRIGLVADAKANLRNQHLLGPNQAYSNMSVDVLQTQSGTNSSQGFNATSMMITVVVEADIIEYGTPPENYEPIVQSTKFLPTDNNSSSVLPDFSGLNDSNISSTLKYQVGDSVIYTKKEVSFDAVIIKIPYVKSAIESLQIEYINNSTTKKKWVYLTEISKK
jgi:hypothetical protein